VGLNTVVLLSASKPFQHDLQTELQNGEQKNDKVITGSLNGPIPARKPAGFPKQSSGLSKDELGNSNFLHLLAMPIPGDPRFAGYIMLCLLCTSCYIMLYHVTDPYLQWWGPICLLLSLTVVPSELMSLLPSG
jgi:hypothetical protein